MDEKPLRIRSLDGLRGLAALLVLVHHSLLLLPALAAPYYSSSNDGSFVVRILTFTPLHFFWMGTETVFVFFVLSGIVLSLPVVRSTKFDWLNYYPKRILRLYLPVFGAILLAIGLLWLVPRSPDILGMGPWAIDRAREFSLTGIVRDATLIFGPSGVISPFWSLRWEVLFSLTLPIYVFFAKRGLKWLPAKIGILVVLLVVAPLANVAPLIFLPIFAVGVLLAQHWTEFVGIGARINGSKGSIWLWLSTAGAALLLLTSYWTARGLGIPELIARASWPLVIFGAVLLVLIAVCNRTIRDVLESPALAWSGRISFSLYLVHEPILLSVRFWIPNLPPWIAIFIGIPVALGVATLFYKFVESPAHRVAKSFNYRAFYRVAGQKKSSPSVADGDDHTQRARSLD